MAQSGQTIAQLVQPVQFGPVDCGGEISLAVGFFRNGDYVVGAYGNTKGAALATFDIDYNFSGHLRIFYRRERRDRREKTEKITILRVNGLRGNCRDIIPKEPAVVKNNEAYLNRSKAGFQEEVIESAFLIGLAGEFACLVAQAEINIASARCADCAACVLVECEAGEGVGIGRIAYLAGEFGGEKCQGRRAGRWFCRWRCFCRR